jgi:hypothetical protein
MGIQRENGQMPVHMTLAEFCETLTSASDYIANIEGGFNFCSNLGQYEWKYIGKRDLLVPYIYDPDYSKTVQNITSLKSQNHRSIRLEQHRVWVVDGNLHRGESNVLARRRFYLDEDSWQIVLGEGYDSGGVIIKSYMLSRSAVKTVSLEGQWYPLHCRENTPTPSS